jgi:hypothetical protein
MKKLAIALALIIGVQAASVAQDRKGDFRNMTPEQRAEKKTARMEQTLNLTADQKKAVYEMNLSAAKNMQANKGVGKEKMMEAHRANDAKLKNILSADQYSKYEQIKAEREKKMQEKRGKRELKKG